MKFKIGDKVRIVKNVWEDGYNHLSVGIGDVCTIIGCNENFKYSYFLDNHMLFSWCDEELELVTDMEIPKIKTVMFNPPATIIFWTDNTKSVVKCQNGEQFDPEKGFVLAYLKKVLGNDNTFNKEIHKWVKYEAPVEEKEIKWRVVDRPAEVGDYIRLTHTDYTFDNIGDILKVDKVDESNGLVTIYEKNHPNIDSVYGDFPWNYCPVEYEVVEKV